MELGERIAVLREEQALTQAELAEAARISPSTLSQIESGKVPRPHVGTVRKIARALGVEPAKLHREKALAATGDTEAPREAGPIAKESRASAHMQTSGAAVPVITIDLEAVRNALARVKRGEASVEEAVEELEALGESA